MWIAAPANTSTAVWYSGEPHDVHVVVERLEPEHGRASRRTSAPPVSGSTPGSAAAHALRPAGRARRVVHHHARRGGRSGIVGRLARLQLLVRRGSRRCRRRPRSGPRRGSRSRRPRPCACSAKRACATNTFASQSSHDVRDLGADEVPVDRHEVEARLADGEVQLEHLGAVRAAASRSRRRAASPSARSPCTNWLHDASSSPAEISALVGVDEREVVGVGLGDLPEPERRRVGRCGGHRVSLLLLRGQASSRPAAARKAPTIAPSSPTASAEPSTRRNWMRRSVSPASANVGHRPPSCGRGRANRRRASPSAACR